MPRHLLVLLALLAAAPASARIHRIAPLLPADAAAAPATAIRSAASQPICWTGRFDCSIDVKYFGGSVLANPRIYAVFWEGHQDPDVAEKMPSFYAALANSEYLDWLTEYSTTVP